MSTQSDYISPSTRWQAFIGSLPFLAFGIISMIGKIDAFHNESTILIYFAFFIGVLAVLLIGWVRGFPLWSYSYLGWSLLFIWWLAGIRINGSHWGIGFWILFSLMISIAFNLDAFFGPHPKVFQ